MSYLDQSIEYLDMAFENDNLIVILAAFDKAFWEPTETMSEVTALIDEVACALPEGDERRDFCEAFSVRLKALPSGTVEFETYLVTALDVTGWARPSPTRVVRRYLDLQHLFETLQRVSRHAGRNRLRAHLAEIERHHKVEKIKRTALAVCTLGVSLAFEDS